MAWSKVITSGGTQTIAGAKTFSSIVKVDAGSANWNATTPGTTAGSIHLDPGVATDHFGSAITFGASDSGDGETAQAGIYTVSDSGYGTKMYLATTGSYGSGSTTALKLSSDQSATFANTVNATTFVGALTGNASGSSATCSGNAATSTKISSITNSNIVQLTSSQTLTNKSISYGQITSAPWTTNTGTVTSVTTSGTVSGITLTGSVTTSGALTLGGSIGIDDLDNVTVSDSAANGSPSTGDIWIEY